MPYVEWLYIAIVDLTFIYPNTSMIRGAKAIFGGTIHSMHESDLHASNTVATMQACTYFNGARHAF